MPTWVLNPKAKTPQPDEELKVLARGEMFENLVQTQAWKEILDLLEQLDEEAVAAVNGNKSSDGNVARHLQTKLQERRYVLNELQHFVLGSIEQRRTILKQQEEDRKIMEEMLHVNRTAGY